MIRTTAQEVFSDSYYQSAKTEVIFIKLSALISTRWDITLKISLLIDVPLRDDSSVGKQDQKKEENAHRMAVLMGLAADGCIGGCGC